MARADVVVVSYNSRNQLRTCIEPLASTPELDVIVVDNASTDGSANSVRDLPLNLVERSTNDGFAVGCNAGWRLGSAPYVLFLNPDARARAEVIERLVAELDQHPQLGAVAPKILHTDGSVDFSVRRFPRLVSSFARALFAHRVFPTASWADEVVRDRQVYERSGPAEWVSGACLLARRDALVRLGGFDERFFMYCEDTDLCRRLWDIGFGIRFVPEAVVDHEGGASAPRAALLSTLTASRIRYARKHRRPPAVVAERLTLALEAGIRILVGSGGAPARRGHLAALACALGLTSSQNA
jgi:N-acetylglucosaminyl-diphospho-decaprenol L-rhamnosyltransferase